MAEQQNQPDYMAVARVLTAHGLRGEIKVELHTDFPERLTVGRRLYLGEEKRPVTLKAARPHQGGLLLTLEDVQDRNSAEALRGAWIYIPVTEAASLQSDEYYVHQIIGLRVVDMSDRFLGTVEEILFTGSNDVYVVRKPQGGELLIPALETVVQTVDLDSGQIRVELPPGLEDAKGELDNK